MRETAENLVMNPSALMRSSELRIDAIQRGYFKFTMPLIQENHNHLQSLYAAACLALGEIPADTLFTTTFDMTYYTFCYKEMNITYTKKALTDISTEIKISDTEVSRINEEVLSKKKSEFKFKEELLNTKNEVVAFIEGIYELRE